jgi:hypothetical protein
MSVREGKESIKMIRVAVEIREGALTHRSPPLPSSVRSRSQVEGYLATG